MKNRFLHIVLAFLVGLFSIFVGYDLANAEAVAPIPKITDLQFGSHPQNQAAGCVYLIFTWGDISPDDGVVSYGDFDIYRDGQRIASQSASKMPDSEKVFLKIYSSQKKEGSKFSVVSRNTGVGSNFVLADSSCSGQIVEDSSTNPPSSGGDGDTGGSNPENPPDGTVSCDICMCFATVSDLLDSIDTSMLASLASLGILIDQNEKIKNAIDYVGFQLSFVSDQLGITNSELIYVNSQLNRLNDTSDRMDSKLGEILYQITPDSYYFPPNANQYQITHEQNKPPMPENPYYDSGVYFSDRGDASVPGRLPSAPEPVDNWNGIYRQNPIQKDSSLVKDETLARDHVLNRESSLEKDEMLEREHVLTRDSSLEKDETLKRDSVSEKSNIFDRSEPLQRNDESFTLRWKQVNGVPLTR